ncbi:hypothetical protein K438DRAFT_895615 [Mycena galopus ATCC 62051]|nr:hypothetical protein K438DRAFT_895615 [Mycena galopus ATCC 62051]
MKRRTFLLLKKTIFGRSDRSFPKLPNFHDRHAQCAKSHCRFSKRSYPANHHDRGFPPSPNTSAPPKCSCYCNTGDPNRLRRHCMWNFRLPLLASRNFCRVVFPL